MRYFRWTHAFSDAAEDVSGYFIAVSRPVSHAANLFNHLLNDLVAVIGEVHDFARMFDRYAREWPNQEKLRRIRDVIDKARTDIQEIITEPAASEEKQPEPSGQSNGSAGSH